MDLVISDGAYVLLRSITVNSTSALYKLVTDGGAEPVLPRIPAVINGDSRTTAAQFSIMMRDTNGTPIDIEVTGP